MPEIERFTVSDRTEYGWSWEGNDPEQWPTSEKSSRATANALQRDAGTPVTKVSRRVFVMTGEWQPAEEETT